MKMCRLANNNIVPHADVLVILARVESLVNALCQGYQHIIPRRLPIVELDNLARCDNHTIFSQEIKDILIGFKLLDRDGTMSDITKNVIQSGLDYNADRSWFYDPVIEIIGGVDSA